MYLMPPSAKTPSIIRFASTMSSGNGGDFLLGVIEGFYNRPWSASQRADLFAKMKDLGNLNAYLYAPKDDHKHMF